MTSSASTLIDSSLDAQLHRDGFVKFPLLDASAVADLREAYGRLHGWQGSGFVSDLTDNNLEYRQQANAAIAESLDQVVTARFADHQPFLRNFLCKFPDGDSGLYLHRDWMYVDERDGHRTHVAWVALEDIDGDNGQLRVLRRSHLVDDQLRGTNLISPWLDHTDVIEPRLLSIPVKAGDCVVFDNAVAHCSYPNYTDTPRVVAAVGLRPAGVPLVHFRRSSDDGAQAERFDVDESFFLTATPQALLAAPPTLKVQETIPIEAYDPTGPELAAQLDDGLRAYLDLSRSRAHQLGRRAASVGSAAAAQGLDAARNVRLPKRDTIGVADRPPLRDRARSLANDLPSRAAIGVLGVNEALINKFTPDHPPVWDPGSFPWTAAIEGAYPEIRREVEGLLAGPTEIPHIEDVTGGIPQGNVGPWRSFVLMHQGRWIDWNCRRCPDTTAAVQRIPGLTMAGFSVLEPGTHITTHRGPNKGALRYQLGVIVPGTEGQCRIKVGDEMLHWRDGESVMFDFTAPHEAWNDSDGIRVLLMLEVITPLPGPLSVMNRMSQHAMGWFPTTRDIKRRLAQLEPSLTKT